ncbi:MAG: HlyD family secretion protein [Inquilinaceae bacterium]
MTGAPFPSPVAMALIFAGLFGSATPADRLWQGYAEGEYVRVGAPLAGTLERLDVSRGDQVQEGNALFALDRDYEAAALSEARDRLRVAEAELADLTKGRRPSEIRAIEARLTQAHASLALSTTRLERQQNLRARDVSAQDSLDEARWHHARDMATVAELEADLETARLAARPDAIDAARAAVAAANQALAQAAWEYDRKAVAAPVSGLVDDTLYRTGEWVAAGAPVVSLLPPENIIVRFFVPQPELSGVQPGDIVHLSCDGCPPRMTATVAYISPEAEYTPPVIYSNEERAKLVFMVEARPDPAIAAVLHPGLPVDVRAGAP